MYAKVDNALVSSLWALADTCYIWKTKSKGLSNQEVLCLTFCKCSTFQSWIWISCILNTGKAPDCPVAKEWCFKRIWPDIELPGANEWLWWVHALKILAYRRPMHGDMNWSDPVLCWLSCTMYPSFCFVVKFFRLLTLASVAEFRSTWCRSISERGPALLCFKVRISKSVAITQWLARSKTSWRRWALHQTSIHEHLMDFSTLTSSSVMLRCDTVWLPFSFAERVQHDVHALLIKM